MIRIEKLIEQWLTQEARRVCLMPLQVPRFAQWPASLSKHHCWKGGLLKHTEEVANIAVDIAKATIVEGKPIDMGVVVMASVYHDFGKIYDYEEQVVIEHGIPIALGTFAKSAHYGMIHHVARSFQLFEENAPTLPADFRKAVSHCILAHHGRLEYGSPVLPTTREAWAVHLADMASVHCIEQRKEQA